MSGVSRYDTDIMELTAQGVKAKQIAAQLGCTVRHVQQVRKDNGYQSGARSCNRERVIELTRQGWTARDIAEQLKMSRRQVVRIRTATHNNVSKKTELFTEDKALRAKAMLEDGASYGEVCRTLHCGFVTIKHRFPGYGWTQAQTAEYMCATRRLRKLVDL